MLDSEHQNGSEPLKAKSFRDLLAKFDQKFYSEGKLLEFDCSEEGTLDTAYNPAPIIIDNCTYVWARVESKLSEKDSKIKLYKENEDGKCKLVKEAPVFKSLQDPFYCGVIDGYHVFGGVQIYDVEGTADLGYRTVFHIYKESFCELMSITGEAREPDIIGPEKMKDIRLIQIANKRIGVFTRPQDNTGYFGGRGRIGYFEIQSINQLGDALEKYNSERNPQTLINGLFVSEGEGGEEWGGANALYPLADGKIGVLGHIAGFGDKKFTDENGCLYARKKDYYPLTFIFDPETKQVSEVKIIATTDQFPPVSAKKIDLGDILYGGGLINTGDGKAWLYLGIGDSQAGRILIEDPFAKYR